MRWLALLLLVPGLAFADASVDFDGTNDYLDLNDVVGIDTMAEFSLSCWVNAGADNLSRQIIIEADAIENKFRFTYNNANPDVVFFWPFKSGTSQGNCTTTIVLDEWHHWGGVMDNADDESRCYYDGVLETTITSVTEVAITATHDTRYGTDVFGNNDFLGQLAWCSIVLADLTAEQMVEGMHTGWYRAAGAEFVHAMWGDSPESDLSGNGVVGNVVNDAAGFADGPPVFFPMGHQ